MTCFSETWIILFGGAGRERILKHLVQEGIKINFVLAPLKQSLKLKASLSEIKKLGLPIIFTNKADVGDHLKNMCNCNILSVGFPYIIPKDVYEKHPLSLNIHPTLLPKYRGPTTGPFILINNENESGSTVHLLAEEVDAGDIIDQSHISISPFDTVCSMQRKVYCVEPDLVINAFKKIDQGIKPTPQKDHEASIYHAPRKPIDSEIDPQKNLLELINWM